MESLNYFLKFKLLEKLKMSMDCNKKFEEKIVLATKKMWTTPHTYIC
jgi:hypothetical protein